MKSHMLQQHRKISTITTTKKAIKSQLLQHDKFMKSQLLQRQLKSNRIPTIKTTTKS